jgi:hypothetical protein
MATLSFFETFKMLDKNVCIGLIRAAKSISAVKRGEFQPLSTSEKCYWCSDVDVANSTGA